MSNSHDVDLHALDLNGLVALDALLRERSVTRAAERAGVSQSAMSHTLRRLRERLDDPLLLRGQGAMVLTPRAEALEIPLRASLNSLARVLQAPPRFDPDTLTRTFRIQSPDLFDVLALPRLLSHFTTHAPGVDLAVTASGANLSDRLETGELDVAVVPVLLGPGGGEIGAPTAPGLMRRTLFRDRFRGFVRAEHAFATRRRPTARQFAAASHVMVSPTGQGDGLVDVALRAKGLARRVSVRVPQFSTALAIVAASDLVLTAPAALQRADTAGRLAVVPLPVSLPPHAITIVWHPRFDADPAHRWFRQKLADQAGALGR